MTVPQDDKPRNSIRDAIVFCAIIKAHPAIATRLQRRTTTGDGIVDGVVSVSSPDVGYVSRRRTERGSDGMTYKMLSSSDRVLGSKKMSFPLRYLSKAR